MTWRKPWQALSGRLLSRGVRSSGFLLLFLQVSWVNPFLWWTPLLLKPPWSIGDVAAGAGSLPNDLAWEFGGIRGLESMVPARLNHFQFPNLTGYVRLTLGPLHEAPSPEMILSFTVPLGNPSSSFNLRWEVTSSVKPFFFLKEAFNFGMVLNFQELCEHGRVPIYPLPRQYFC